MKKHIRIFSLIIGLIAIDQLTKYLALTNLRGSLGITIRKSGRSIWNSSGSSEHIFADHGDCSGALKLYLYKNTTE